MPQVASDSADDSNVTSAADQKFKMALKNMLPIPSNSEQQIILDEYNSQLTQFSIAINRILREEVSDENCVYLLKLMAGMYTLLKTTLLAPSVYRELFEGIIGIEYEVRRYISQWAKTAQNGIQIELFALAWWCESALPRAYLVCLLFASLNHVQSEPDFLAKTLSACKAIQHPLKGSFLYSHFHSFLKQIYFSPSEEEPNSQLQTLCLGYSIETFTTLLRFFCRWHQSLPSKSTEPAYTASLYQETFSGFFEELARITSFDMFETVVLPTILVEVVNCADSLAQSLIFTSITKGFDSQYLLAQLGPLIKSSSQFAQGIDLKGLLDQLFRKVQSAQATQNDSLFSTIWDETSKLIKNRCEIDQCDTVLISSLVLSLIVNTSEDEHVHSITTVLDFLIKTLKTLRPEGFNSETSNVGAEIVHLIRNLMHEFEGHFEDVILKLPNLPVLLTCLKPASARKCCLNQILPSLKDLSRQELYPDIIKLFACFTKSDLTQLIGDDNNEGCITQAHDITADLKMFTDVVIDLLPSECIPSFFKCIDNSSSCLNLFIIPELLERSDFNPILSRSLISSLLQNTSTVLSQRLENSENVQWIEPEYTKLMACKMNLRVIEVLAERNSDPYDFYTEILNILNCHVSQDYLKIQIIENCLGSFAQAGKSLQPEDFQCLLDHLSKEAGQLLRKSDRCRLLLRIAKASDKADCKYLDQVGVLLNQLPANEEAMKFDHCLEFFGLVMKERRLKDEEIGLYQWAAGYVETSDPSKELQFYTIKLQYEQANEKTEDEFVHETDITNPDTHDTHDTQDTYPVNVYNDFVQMESEFELEQQTEEDLQKLKIFASFQL